MSYSLALGPFHPAWRGPQRLLLRVDGERVADLEYRDEYNERGCAERIARVDLTQGLYVASRVCGTCSVAHAMAFCQAFEQLCSIDVGTRAAFLRCIAAELERAASHVQAAALLLDVLGLDRRASRLHGLRDIVTGLQKTLTGAPVAPDFCLPGGTKRDLAQCDQQEFGTTLPKIQRGLYRFIDALIDHRALLGRTVGVGALPRTAAEQYGVRGPLARASGINRDTRIDHPYGAYGSLTIRMITQDGGDVYARLVVLLLEALESIKLVEQAVQELPDGEYLGAWPDTIPNGLGSGMVEGPHGAIRYTLEAEGQRIRGVRIDTPRQLDRLLARTLLSGALLDNVVPIIASCDVCSTCAEK